MPDATIDWYAWFARRVKRHWPPPMARYFAWGCLQYFHWERERNAGLAAVLPEHDCEMDAKPKLVVGDAGQD